MDILGVIPARYSSTRFEGKILADLLGKPMIQHVWERAKQSLLLDEVLIACDEEKVAVVCREFGAKVVMTAKGHTSGTDRICEVVNPIDVKIVVNIQADEPLVHPMMIDTVARALSEDKTLSVATLMKKIEDPALISNPDVVKVVVDKNNFALYFSRSPIPFKARNSSVGEPVVYKHIGLYAYTKDFLFIYKNIPTSSLEKTECLEQLRILQDGYRIKVLETRYDTIGVDTPEDLKQVKIYVEKIK